MSTNVNDVISVDKSDKLLEMIYTKMCSSAKQCMPNVSIDKAPKLTVRIGNNEITLLPEDYLAGQNVALISDVGRTRSSGECSPDVSIVLGRLFFDKYSVLFTKHASKPEGSMTFVSKHRPRKLTFGQ